ncbi:MAG: hypothetical protein K6F75_02480 [Butyrivibrio sp.]|nr:hypothetical protein [Butyrivibrio sp.]
MGNTDKNLLLSQRELLILLYKYELSGLIFPESLTSVSANDEELKTAMAELIQDGYLVPGENDMYKLAPEIRRVMDTLVNSVNTYVVQSNREELAGMYVYSINSEAVVIEQDSRHKGWIKIRAVHLKDFIDDLTEYDFMPKGGMNLYIFSKQEAVVDLNAEPEEVLKNDKVCLLIERFRKGTLEREKCICITREPALDWIYVAKNGKTEMMLYSPELFSDSVMED